MRTHEKQGRMCIGLSECYDATLSRKWKLDALLLLQAVTKMIQEACTYVEKTPNMEVKLKLIDTLRTVTAGKVCYLQRVLVDKENGDSIDNRISKI